MLEERFKISDFHWDRKTNFLVAHTSRLPVYQQAPLEIIITGKRLMVKYKFAGFDHKARHSVYRTSVPEAEKYTVVIPWSS